MQLVFDWQYRDRSATRINDCLKEIGVAESQRAAVLLVYLHPRSRLLDASRQVVALKTSYRRGAAWIAANSPCFSKESVSHTALHRAICVWSRFGVMAATERRPTCLLLNGDALREWSNCHQIGEEDLLQQIETVRARSQVFAPVRKCSQVSQSMSDRGSESYSFQEETNNSLNQSITLPALPAEAFDRNLSDSRLYDVLAAWWRSEGLTDRGMDPDAVLGAVLAARKADSTSPQRYVETCLANGVRPHWINRASLLRARRRRERGYAPTTNTPERP